MPSKTKKRAAKSSCAHQDSLYHSRYTKLIIFIVMLGVVPSGIFLYYEVAILFVYLPHLSNQTLLVIAIGTGAILTSMLLPYVGRRRVLIYNTLLFIPAYILTSLLQGHHAYDLLARSFAGVGIGANLTSTILYVSELTLPRYRGRHYSLVAFAFFLGGILCAILNAFYPYLLLCMLLFPLLFLILALIYLPETPFYVMQVGHDSWASEILYFLRCGPIEEQNFELVCIKKFVVNFKCVPPGWFVFDRVLTIVLLVAATWLNGFPLFLIVSKNFKWRFVSFVTWGIIGVAALIGFVINYIVIVRVSRSLAVILSVLGTFLGNFLLCLYLGVFDVAILYYIALGVYFIGFFLGFAMMFFLLAGEMFPYKIKHVYVAYAVVMYFAVFVFSGFIAREFCLALGAFLTSVYFLIQNLLGLAFAFWVMPGYKVAHLLKVQGYFDGGIL